MKGACGSPGADSSRVLCSGQLQLDCTPAVTGNSTQCYVAGDNSLQTCDPTSAGDPIKLPILMVRARPCLEILRTMSEVQPFLQPRLLIESLSMLSTAKQPAKASQHINHMAVTLLFEH